MFSGIRGLAQSFVRGAVAIGRGVKATYEALTDLGLGYIEEQFKQDWGMYDQQKAFVDLAGEVPKDQLIPGVIHGETQQSLTARFKYDVRTVYEDVKGRLVTKHWSVISNTRMTQNEILDYADIFAEDYAPEGYPYHMTPELEGIWVRAGQGF